MMLSFLIFSIQMIAVSSFSLPTIMHRHRANNILQMRAFEESSLPKSLKTFLGGVIFTFGMFNNNYNNQNIVFADSQEIVSTFTDVVIPKVPLYVKKSSDLQSYSDVGRGFRLLRPFGFNEFDGAGGGYAVKFASLFDVDENVIIGSVPASSGKTSITDYGSLQAIGNKLAAKRNGLLTSSSARETDGIVFYQFQFENPLETSLPRPGSKSNPPTKGIELYELCVHKGRLWNVQATSNDKLFPGHEATFRAVLSSFVPKL